MKIKKWVDGCLMILLNGINEGMQFLKLEPCDLLPSIGLLKYNMVDYKLDVKIQYGSTIYLLRKMVNTTRVRGNDAVGRLRREVVPIRVAIKSKYF